MFVNKIYRKFDLNLEHLIKDHEISFLRRKTWIPQFLYDLKRDRRSKDIFMRKKLNENEKKIGETWGRRIFDLNIDNLESIYVKAWGESKMNTRGFEMKKSHQKRNRRSCSVLKIDSGLDSMKRVEREIDSREKYQNGRLSPLLYLFLFVSRWRLHSVWFLKYSSKACDVVTQLRYQENESIAIVTILIWCDDRNQFLYSENL